MHFSTLNFHNFWTKQTLGKLIYKYATFKANLPTFDTQNACWNRPCCGDIRCRKKGQNPFPRVCKPIGASVIVCLLLRLVMVRLALNMRKRMLTFTYVNYSKWQMTLISQKNISHLKFLNPSNANATFVQSTRMYDFCKPSNPCHAGINWIALAEYSQMSTHVLGHF